MRRNTYRTGVSTPGCHGIWLYLPAVPTTPTIMRY